jgi:ZIP family zinc transporter
MNAFLLSLVAFCSTSAGGLCALGVRRRLHLALGFAAGALLGVVAFDLLPEIFALSYRSGDGDCRAAMTALAGGFLLLHSLEKTAPVLRARRGHDHAHRDPQAGVWSAAGLVVHSFIDGAGIGIAFQVSPAVGFTVAIAVIAHDFCDGLNTVSLLLAHRNTTAVALGVLALDAVAPILGALSTSVYRLPASMLVLWLGFFAGFLLYIGTLDILPRAHARAGPAAASLVGLPLLGAAFIYLVQWVAA